jgi:hypothetical protein
MTVVYDVGEGLRCQYLSVYSECFLSIKCTLCAADWHLNYNFNSPLLSVTMLTRK